jgi:hypothetical protein
VPFRYTKQQPSGSDVVDASPTFSCTATASPTADVKASATSSDSINFSIPYALLAAVLKVIATITCSQLVLKHVSIEDHSNIELGMMIHGTYFCFCQDQSVDSAQSNLRSGEVAMETEMGQNSDSRNSKLRKENITDCSLCLHVHAPSGTTEKDEVVIRLEGCHSEFCMLQDYRKALHPEVEHMVLQGYRDGLEPNQLIARAYTLSGDVFERKQHEMNSFTSPDSNEQGGNSSAPIAFSPVARSRGARLHCRSPGVHGADEHTVFSSNGEAYDAQAGVEDSSAADDFAETSALAELGVQILRGAECWGDVDKGDSDSIELENQNPIIAAEEPGKVISRWEYRDMVKPPLHASAEAKEAFAEWFETLYERGARHHNLPFPLWTVVFNLPQLLTDYNLHNLQEAVGHLIHSYKSNDRGGLTCSAVFYLYIDTLLRAESATCNVEGLDADGNVFTMRDALATFPDASTEDIGIITSKEGLPYNSSTFSLCADAVALVVHKCKTLTTLGLFCHTALQRCWIKNIPAVYQTCANDDTFNTSRFDLDVGAAVFLCPITQKYLPCAVFVAHYEKGKDNNKRESEAWIYTQWRSFGYNLPRYFLFDCCHPSFNALTRVILADLMVEWSELSAQCKAYYTYLTGLGDADCRRNAGEAFLLALQSGTLCSNDDVRVLVQTAGFNSTSRGDDGACGSGAAGAGATASAGERCLCVN